MRQDGPVAVLVIQADLRLGRRLARVMARQADVRIATWADDAWEARLAIVEQHPDVLLLDVGLSGWLGLLRSLRQYYPVPVIACGSNEPRSRTNVLQAVARGAMDFVIRPASDDLVAWQKLAGDLREKVLIAAREFRPVPAARLAAWRVKSFAESGLNPRRYVIGVGASTGGPEALRTLLANAPADFPPVVVVQHMPAAFTRGFAERLDRYSAMSVSEARQGDVLAPGRALVARGDTHLTVRQSGQSWHACYTHQQPVGRHCPSVDVLFESLAPFGNRAVGVLLTGMGADGARGLLRLHQAGALTVAQDRESSAVYGMPKAANDLGAVEFTAAPTDIPEVIRQALAAQAGRQATAERSKVATRQAL
jgi:two-component system chemotaxis response regulator CheB